MTSDRTILIAVLDEGERPPEVGSEIAHQGQTYIVQSVGDAFVSPSLPTSLPKGAAYIGIIVTPKGARQ